MSLLSRPRVFFETRLDSERRARAPHACARRGHLPTKMVASVTTTRARSRRSSSARRSRRLTTRGSTSAAGTRRTGWSISRYPHARFAIRAGGSACHVFPGGCLSRLFLVGSFVNIARSADAACRPCLLVIFDRFPGIVSHSVLFASSGGTAPGGLPSALSVG